MHHNMWPSDVIPQTPIPYEHNEEVITRSWLEAIWGKKHEAETAEKVVWILTEKEVSLHIFQDKLSYLHFH